MGSTEPAARPKPGFNFILNALGFQHPRPLIFSALNGFVFSLQLSPDEEVYPPPRITIQAGWVALLLALVLSPGAGRAQTSTVQYINGEPAFMSNELLISFGPTEVINEAVDNPELNDGSLSQFVKASALALIQQRTGVSLNAAPTRKIFLRMKSSDSLSIARDDDTVRVFPFWATFSVSVNGGSLSELRTLGDTLRSVYPTILAVSFNLIAHTDGFPNDLLLRPKQYSLYPNVTHPNSSILATNGWGLETGKPLIRVGIFDSGIRSTHEDFGGGTATPAVVGGWNYVANAPITNYPSGGPHGTAVAGIVGARRNNLRGVAGIAGGDGTTASGVNLYDMTILNPDNSGATTAGIVTALTEGALSSPNATFGFRLSVLNLSVGIFASQITPQESALLRQAIKTCHQNRVVVVAARGNDGANGNPVEYPACYDDDWIISVSASGTDGEIKRPGNGDPNNMRDGYTSSYGYGVDVMAPGTTALVHSTGNASDAAYVGFNGTSAAAPHVAGVASLLLSYSIAPSPRNPNNLRPSLLPEDVEQILQRTASDRHRDIANNPLSPGYDDYSGWGLLNTYQALNFIGKSRREIRHIANLFTGTGSLPPDAYWTKVVSRQRMFLASGYGSVAAGVYIVDVYKMTATTPLHISRYQEGVIKAAWPIRVYSTLWGPPTGVILSDSWGELNAWSQPDNGPQNPRDFTGHSVTYSGYVYHIRYDVIGRTINQYLPYDPQRNGRTTTLGASFHVEAPSGGGGGGGGSQAVLEVQVFPNPATDAVDLLYETEEPGDVTIDIYDTQGVSRKHMVKEGADAGSQQDHLLLTDLPTGVYECQVVTPTAVLHETIIRP